MHRHTHAGFFFFGILPGIHAVHVYLGCMCVCIHAPIPVGCAPPPESLSFKPWHNSDSTGFGRFNRTGSLTEREEIPLNKHSQSVISILFFFLLSLLVYVCPFW